MQARAPLFPNSMQRFLPSTLVLAIAALGVAACSPAYIPNTDVEDNSQNRKIVSFCEDYRHAVEDKNVGQLLKMASQHYHEDGGNTNPEDDIDYAGLQNYLSTSFEKAQQIRYEIRYRKIQVTETNHVYVDYTYAASYKLPGASKEEWRHTVADNRLDLIPDGDSYKILGGM
jgi:hypothetical protein